MSKLVVKSITANIPDAWFEANIGVTPRAVRAARENGKFPARWFAALHKECERRGIPCPLSAFNFKSPSADTTISEAS